ncbi:hypothetical protein OKW60_003860 [Vibrio alginolyticus]|nr:hypothetical protein [Vibrio alginolyticus]ELA9731629.1 hypothetical protein [Vibrio alginolyticus]ELB2902744.1 hypothetical protein [Vibrio alginolyticus]
MNNWLIRFSMGLPCRPEDRKEMEEVLPELFQSDKKRKLKPTLVFPFFLYEFDTRELSSWARSCEEADRTEKGRIGNHEVCPVCSKPLNSSNTGESDYLNLEISGGLNRKSSVSAFMQLVTRNRKANIKPPIKDVYFTDRFLLADAGEAGSGGGYDNIISYLENLAIEKDTEFTVHTPNWPTKSLIQKERGDCLSSAQRILKNLIEQNYPNVKFAQLPQKPVFHDRLYLARGSDSQINGVFGPSLNGLGSQDIALMGEIEDKNLLDTLSGILSGRNG